MCPPGRRSESASTYRAASNAARSRRLTRRPRAKAWMRRAAASWRSCTPASASCSNGCCYRCDPALGMGPRAEAIRLHMGCRPEGHFTCPATRWRPSYSQAWHSAAELSGSYGRLRYCLFGCCEHVHPRGTPGGGGGADEEGGVAQQCMCTASPAHRWACRDPKTWWAQGSDPGTKQHAPAVPV
jgi:hypothetical protein